LGGSGHKSHDKWVPVTTVWRVLRLWIEERPPIWRVAANKPGFDVECLDFLDQRKQAKMQWIQDPSRRNVDNLNNVRCDVSRHFRNKKKAYLKAKI